MKSMIALAAGVFFSHLAAAQTAGSTVLVDAMAKHWQTSKALTLAVAEAMPEEGYSFKATDPEMSFGGQMNHIAMANGRYCSFALGEKPPIDKAGEDTKVNAEKNLNTAFDYCLAGIKKMTDADLEHTVEVRGKAITKFELMWGGFTHTAHHRGQAEVYLRLKGVTPPTYEF